MPCADAATQREDDSDDAAPLLDDEGAVPDALFWRVMWRVVPLPWLGYVLNIIDRTNLAYAQLQMKTDIGLSARDFGFASGVFFVAYAVMQVPTNHLIGDPRIGAARVLSASMILWGVSATATAFVALPWHLYALRFCLGLSESAFFPGVLLYLTRWFPEAMSGRAAALFVSAASVGGLLSSAGSGALLSALDGVFGVRGWRWLLALEGVPTVLLGVVAPLLLDEQPEHAAWLTTAERRTLTTALAKDEERRVAALADLFRGLDTGRSLGEATTTASDLPPQPPLPPPASATLPKSATSDRADRLPLLSTSKLALLHTPCLLFCLQYIVSAALTNTTRFFLPTLLKEAVPSLPPWGLGLVFAVFATFKVVLSPPLAAWADAGGAQRRFNCSWGLYAAAAVLYVLAGFGMMMMPAGRSMDYTWRTSSLVALLAVADVLSQLSIPIFWALHHSMQPAVLKGCSIALVNSIGNGVGGFFGPFLLGAMHDAFSAAVACRGTKHASARIAVCTGQWGPGTVLVGLATLAGTAVSAAILHRRNLASVSAIVHAKPPPSRTVSAMARL